MKQQKHPNAFSVKHLNDVTAYWKLQIRKLLHSTRWH